MEIHEYVCDCCGEKIEENELYTVTRKHNKPHYSPDMFGGKYVNGTDVEFEQYHLCKQCWQRIRDIIRI